MSQIKVFLFAMVLFSTAPTLADENETATNPETAPAQGEAQVDVRKLGLPGIYGHSESGKKDGRLIDLPPSQFAEEWPSWQQQLAQDVGDDIWFLKRFEATTLSATGLTDNEKLLLADTAAMPLNRVEQKAVKLTTTAEQSSVLQRLSALLNSLSKTQQLQLAAGSSLLLATGAVLVLTSSGAAVIISGTAGALVFVVSNLTGSSYSDQLDSSVYWIN